MKVDTYQLADLHLDPANARAHDDANIAAIKASLARFGQQKPIVVDSKHVIRAGNGTYIAAKLLGWTEIQASVSDLSPSELKLFAIADNRTAELASWNAELLQTTVADADPEFRAAMLLTDDDLEQLAREAGAGDPDSDSPDSTWQEDEDAVLLAKLSVTIAEPQTKLSHGDVWMLGTHAVLVVVDVVTEPHLWMRYLDARLAGKQLFAPYPGPLMTFAQLAADKQVLMVQPDLFIGGHIVDHYLAARGAGSAKKLASVKADPPAPESKPPPESVTKKPSRARARVTSK